MDKDILRRRPLAFGAASAVAVWVGCGTQRGPVRDQNQPAARTRIERFVDPEVRAAFASMPPVDPDLAAVPQHRRELEQFLAGAENPARSTEHNVPGPPAAPSVRVRVYRPAVAPNELPALLWMHGGGWTLGRPEMDGVYLQRLADQVPAVVVSVDYRLAPEHPYPAALDDAAAALAWTRAAADELGIDAERIAVGGTSSGANLAAALALRARDAGGPTIAFQLLLYPVLDDRLETQSMRTIADPRTVTRAFFAARWRAYLGPNGHAGPYAAPARAADLSRLPPAFILAAGQDALRDEGVAYASRLWAAGVGCDLHVVGGGIHGFDVIAPDTEVSRSALALQVAALRRAVGR